MSLCPPCREKADSWLDSRPQDVFPQLALAGAQAAYDLTAAGSSERRRARYERWRELINEQRAAIRTYCASNHGEASGG